MNYRKAKKRYNYLMKICLFSFELADLMNERRERIKMFEDDKFKIRRKYRK